MYPYQLGHHNEEAIESGAFWFYRKLGFRPGRPDLLRLVEREEQRIARDPKHRTSARTLRRLAEGHAFYELSGSETGAWDRFSTRNLGLQVNRRMARSGKNLDEFKNRSTMRLKRILDKSYSGHTSPVHGTAFQNFAMLATLLPDLASWSTAEKKSFAEIIRAKSSADEMGYLHLLQTHDKLRDSLLKFGSQI